MRTSNPALSDKVFLKASHEAVVGNTTMTLEGAIWKTGVLLAILVAAAAFTWSQTLVGVPAFTTGGAVHAPAGPMPPQVTIYIFAGLIGGLIAAIATVFVPRIAPYTAPIYAALEGLALGGISANFEYKFPGIVVQAVMLTFGTLAALLVAYRSGLIKATENFRLGLAAATGAVCLVYLVTLGLSFFNIRVPYIHEGGPIGVLFSLFVVAVAALNLVLDFDFIERGVERKAPKYMEWYAGFGLLVTLVWLYLEILRLLAKTRRSR